MHLNTKTFKHYTSNHLIYLRQTPPVLFGYSDFYMPYYLSYIEIKIYKRHQYDEVFQQITTLNHLYTQLHISKGQLINV